jgi:ABC-type branched-subunit amino acid transport system substrate-binding protein
MKQSKFRLSFLGAMAAMALISCEPQGSNDSGKEFLVGVVADHTGFMSGHGQSIEMGAHLAADQINARGGVLGRKIKLIVLDGQSDPATSGTRARELIDRYHVSLLLGTTTSATTLAAIPAATEGKTPFIYALDGEDKTCRSSDPGALNPYAFGSGFTERMAVEPLLKFLVSRMDRQQSGASVFFLGGDYVYPRTTNAYAIEVAKHLGLKVVGDEFVDTAATDYSPIIRKILAAAPDILIVTNPGASGVTFMRQARQFSLQNKMLISGFATFDQEAIDAMGVSSEGVFVINRYSMNLNSPLNAEFVKAFRLAYPDSKLLPGPTAAAGAYGALVVAARAAERARSVSSEAIIKGMDGLTVDLPQGTVTVSPRNHIFEQPLYIMRIHNQSYEVVQSLPILSHPGFVGCSVR